MNRRRHIRCVTMAFVLYAALASAGAAPAPAAYHLYIARFYDSDLVILDSATREELGRIEFGPGANPSHIVLSPDYGYLYVSLRGVNEVAVIDTKERKLKARIKVGRHPHYMAITADGKRLVVGNNQDTRASIIDLTTNTVVGEPGISRGSSGVAITADGRFAYVISIYGADISVIDIEKMERVSVIKLIEEYPDLIPIEKTIPHLADSDVAPEKNPGLEGMVMPRGGHLVYFCARRSNRVLVLDTKTNRITGYIQAPRAPIYMTSTPDGAGAFVLQGGKGSESISFVDLEKLVVIKSIKVGFQPMASAISPDGKFLFVTNYGNRDDEGSISVIDMTTLEEIDRIKFWRGPRAIAVTPAR